MGDPGLEPETSCLQIRYSTSELQAPDKGRGACQYWYTQQQQSGINATTHCVFHLIATLHWSHFSDAMATPLTLVKWLCFSCYVK